jgi:hypothetical protein
VDQTTMMTCTCGTEVATGCTCFHCWGMVDIRTTYHCPQCSRWWKAEAAAPAAADKPTVASPDSVC